MSRSKRRLRPAMAGVALAAVAAVGVGVAVGTGNGGDRTDEVKSAVVGGTARNVIFLLGDGMGDSEITIARNYAYGAAGRLPGIDALPLTGEATTYSLLEGGADNGKPNYVTDSAAAGTAWATGHKTSNGRISTDIADKSLPTILEQAQEAGFLTGNVSTAEITDATPAVLNAHINDRGCQGPANMADCPDYAKPGGPGSIAEQTVDHGVDVVLGGGKARFDQKITAGKFAGKTVIESAEAQGYQLVTDAKGLDGFSNKGGKKVLGLFNKGNMTLEWSGLLAAHPASGPQVCKEDNRVTTAPNEPSLEDMTKKAIAILDSRTRKAEHGFFLQVEGASIDKQDHASNPCGQIGETVAFDRAIQVARAYAAKHPDTLIVVTADHAHTSQIVEEVDDTTPGAQSILTTKDGVPMFINYATVAPGPTASQQHTGAEVRIAAQGPQAANVVGIIDETDEFAMMRRALGLD